MAPVLRRLSGDADSCTIPHLGGILLISPRVRRLSRKPPASGRPQQFRHNVSPVRVQPRCCDFHLSPGSFRPTSVLSGPGIYVLSSRAAGCEIVRAAVAAASTTTMAVVTASTVAVMVAVSASVTMTVVAVTTAAAAVVMVAGAAKTAVASTL